MRMIQGKWFAGAVAMVFSGGICAVTEAGVYLDFEGYDTSVMLHGQDGWATTVSTTRANSHVVETVDDGAYIGGKAIGNKASGGGYFGYRDGLPAEAASAGAIRADFFSGDAGYDDDGIADNIVWLDIWQDNGDDTYQSAERMIGFGIDDGTGGVSDFQIAGASGSESGGSGNSGLPYEVDKWYRLTLTWSEVFDNAGTPARNVSLHALNLSDEQIVNSGAPVATATIANTQFQFSQWSGLENRATRGLIDNVEFIAIPEPGTALLATLASLALGLRRRGAR